MKASYLSSFVAVALVVVGCGRNDVKVYQVETNDVASLPAPAAGPVNSLMAGMRGEVPTPDHGAMPQLKYTIPADWKEKELTQLRVASFEVVQNGKSADVSVIPLGGAAGGDAANVNRWRGQVGLQPLPEDELEKSAVKLVVAGQPANLYELTPTSEDSPAIIGLILHLADTAWFFKISGDSELVSKQKDNFITFLDSVEFGGLPAPSTMDLSKLPASHPAIPGMDAGSSAGASSLPAWKIPAGWQPGELAQFLLARYVINGPAGVAATVNVSQLSGDGGGLAANVNRWRKQLGLEPVSDEEVAKLPSVEVAGQKAVLVEATGTDARSGQPAGLVGMVLPVGGQTWFFKLTGDPGVVMAQKAALVGFVQSATYAVEK